MKNAFSHYLQYNTDGEEVQGKVPEGIGLREIIQNKKEPGCSNLKKFIIFKTK